MRPARDAPLRRLRAQPQRALRHAERVRVASRSAAAQPGRRRPGGDRVDEAAAEHLEARSDGIRRTEATGRQRPGGAQATKAASEAEVARLDADKLNSRQGHGCRSIGLYEKLRTKPGPCRRQGRARHLPGLPHLAADSHGPAHARRRHRPVHQLRTHPGRRLKCVRSATSAKLRRPRAKRSAAQNRRFLDFCEAQGYEVATTFAEEAQDHLRRVLPQLIDYLKQP